MKRGLGTNNLLEQSEEQFENPFALNRTFGRKIIPAAPTASTAAPAILKQRQGDRRITVKERNGDRRIAGPHITGYSGMERRSSRGTRRVSLIDRRKAAAALRAEAEKNFVENVLKRRKQTEVWYVNPEVDMSSPRLREYQDFIQETITKTLDVLKLAHLSKPEAAEQIALLVKEIAKHHNFAVTPVELENLCRIAADDMLGLGPLEPLLSRMDVDEIMVNGPNCIYVEINGVIERSSVTFRNERQLVSICQRIVGKVGRRVDESSPICDARLADGSRVNIILPPLAVKGTILTIRKFPAETMTLEKLAALDSVDAATAELIRIIAACRINVLVSGGTGSGKTTMLNCLTKYIGRRERIVTCEDAVELQLQQPHVLQLETRPASIEGTGAVTMRDLVKNSLRMRPDRIIVGEVRGAEAFDLLSAMSTGHDGSMGTLHANTPRDALSRLENMIAMAGLNLPLPSVRQQISTAVNVIIHVQRVKDGSRKVVSISEVTGMEGDVISLQELVTYQYTGKDANGRSIGAFKLSNLRPKFFDKLAEYDMEEKFVRLMERAQI